MAFVKVVKNKAYFKRYQVKYRRRREGKTDYYARRRLVLLDKNKYNAEKHRFVVRLSNTKVVCQVVYSTIRGDCIVASASSTELPRYGISVGLNNYAAAYCTGLLVARRVLKHLGMDGMFEGQTPATGEDYHVEENFDDRRPFKCFLDIGIARATVGNRVFGAMKGGCDGGLHIPHSDKRLPGWKPDGFDAEKHRERIFGVHVANYMRLLKEESPDKYEMHFSRYISKGIGADDIEELYKTAHEKIRANPELAKPEQKQRTAPRREGSTIKTFKGSYTRNLRLTCEERKERVKRKMDLVREKMSAAE